MTQWQTQISVRDNSRELLISGENDFVTWPPKLQWCPLWLLLPLFRAIISYLSAVSHWKYINYEPKLLPKTTLIVFNHHTMFEVKTLCEPFVCNCGQLSYYDFGRYCLWLWPDLQRYSLQNWHIENITTCHLDYNFHIHCWKSDFSDIKNDILLPGHV